jgi:pimeloyl-ACP methyl ester carboxylesterase
VTLPHDERGSGTAVVLLHAGIADRRMWAEHLEPIADAGWRAIAIDLPGFGQAPAAPQLGTPWMDVLDTLDALGIERAVLVGCSFGGAIAQRVALLAPGGLVAGIVLVSSVAEGIDPSPRLEAAWEAEEAALERGDTAGAVDAVLDAWTLPDAPPELRERIAAMQARAFELQQGAGEEEGEDPLEEDPQALASVRVPALVLVGEHDMTDFHRAAAELARMLDASDPIVIAGAGHLAPMETPAAFEQLLLGFLGALEDS